jgi:hypothetical protein
MMTLRINKKLSLMIFGITVLMGNIKTPETKRQTTLGIITFSTKTFIINM